VRLLHNVSKGREGMTVGKLSKMKFGNAIASSMGKESAKEATVQYACKET
jgi:hypothetical protein